jgi:GT2 family glycosyltransferase
VPADLHIAIPNNNKRDLLRQSLQALPGAATRYTLSATVVDNASTDGSADMVATDFPDVGLVRRTAKHGSSANFNVGLLAAASARYLGIMHEDAYPNPGAFDSVLAFLDAHPRAGGLSPRIRFPDGELDSTPRRFPTVLGESLGKLRPLSSWFGVAGYDEETSEAFRVDYNSATCLIFRHEALERVGLFDESFVIFYEEVDLSRRLADDGWETWFVPEAEVVHAGGITRQRQEVSTEVQARYRAIANHYPGSKYLYFRKHTGRSAELALRAIDVTISSLRIMLGLTMRMAGRERTGTAGEVAYQLSVLRNAAANWPPLDPALEVRLPRVGPRE